MSLPFVHLHNHTEYSLLDGANRIPNLVQRVKALGMPACASTDHGAMFGCMEFYYECMAHGIKPILGMEAYVAPNGLTKKSGREENETYHLLLLAKNLEGYRNLCRLHTVAAVEGFYYRPRIDHELLKLHSKGLIGSTTCIGSEVNQHLIKGDFDKAQYVAGMYKEIFDEGSFFVELQNHGLKEQAIMNEGLLKIAKELKLPLVATNDAHFLCQNDAESHDILWCIGLGKTKSDPNRMRFTGQEYIKTREEMAALFPDHPEALENTLMIASMCDVQLGKQRADMPTPDLPEGFDSMQYLRHLARKGLEGRMPGAEDSAWQRLDYELGVIEKTGYANYFLLVNEFAQFTRDQGIMFGVRGSAAGSLVSYTVGITDVNPVEYDLTFERFLNPERISMPDIDMDFEDARRDEVIKWVTQKYGSDRVAQIITFGTMGAKGALRDAARVLELPLADVDRLCKAIPTGPNWTIESAERDLPEFRQIRDADPRLKSLVETAKNIEGLARHAGVHAAGIVIADKPLDNYIPLHRSNDGVAVTAYDMNILEKIGLLKMDFLGLSNLTVLAKAIKNIRVTYGHLPQEQIASEHPVLLQGGHTNIPFDNQKTYDMLGRGETVGVFQLESGGMRRNIVELKPQNVRELAAMVALYRPGPMEHIPTFVSNKFGRTKPEILAQVMVPVLEETFGVIVYQDQVIKLVQAMAGFSLGKADILRKAMGKKDRAVMDTMQVEFETGCVGHGISQEIARKVWDLLVPFSGYAFNKAHAVCYAILSYQTAYLKANYSVEYMAALLAVYRTKEDKVTTFIEECRRQKINVLPPDVNASDTDFTIAKGKDRLDIRFGMGAIKGVGEGLVDGIMAEREANGPFIHLYEFCERVKPAGLAKTALDALIRAGAFDSLSKNRNVLLNVFEGALVYADNAIRLKESGQDSLFGEAGESPELKLPVLPDAPKPSRTEILKMEKETMGIYVSDHPLRGYERSLATSVTHSCAAVLESESSIPITIAGVLAQVSRSTTRSGKKMCRIVLEDFTGQVTCIVFEDTLAKYDQVIEKDKVVVIKGRIRFDDRVQSSDRKPEVQIFEVAALATPHDVDYGDSSVVGSVIMRIKRATKEELLGLRTIVETNPGDYEVVLLLEGAKSTLPVVLLNRVSATQDILRWMRQSVTACEIELVSHAVP